MNITKVSIESENDKGKALAICSVVLDNELKLTKIKLYYNKEKGYYLVLPSKQDTYQEVQNLNKDLDISIPEGKCEKKYDEYYFPVERSFYKNLLDVIVDCFFKSKKEGVKSFRF